MKKKTLIETIDKNVKKGGPHWSRRMCAPYEQVANRVIAKRAGDVKPGDIDNLVDKMLQLSAEVTRLEFRIQKLEEKHSG